MSESVHGALPTREELRTSLHRLEEVLARHGARLAHADEDPEGEPVLHLLRRCMLLMQQEAERLRALLAPQR
jgi:hypothetical protein